MSVRTVPMSVLTVATLVEFCQENGYDPTRTVVLVNDSDNGGFPAPVRGDWLDASVIATAAGMFPAVVLEAFDE